MNKDAAQIFERYQLLNEDTLSSGSMTVEQLKDYLISIKGATPVYVELEAPAKMNKKDKAGNPNPYLNAIKHSTINGIAGGDWEIMMKTREPPAPNAPPAPMSLTVGHLCRLC